MSQALTHEMIVNKLAKVISHLVEAGSTLKEIPMDECQELQAHIYSISKELLSIIDDQTPRIKKQRELNNLYKDDINNILDGLEEEGC